MAPPEPAPILGVTAIKPIERHGFEAISWFCWDRNRRAIMGRTPKSWGLIILFYMCYYFILASFWSLMMYIFFTTIVDDRPKWAGEESLIGTSPGLGLRPSPPDDSITSSMIIFNKDLDQSTMYVPGYEVWKEQVDTFLNKNYNHKNGTRTCQVNEDNYRYRYRKKPKLSCKFDLAVLGDCDGKRDPYYGYRGGRPCLYFKLNRIYDVFNEPYDETLGDPDYDFPLDMPESLRQHINRMENKNQVWLDCQGEDPADKEAIGPMVYFPKERGFPSQYFPYMNHRPYESPVVAVKFTNPKVGQLLHIECRAWARNIKYSRKHRIGMVRFELFILDKNNAKLYEKSLKTGESVSADTKNNMN